MTTFMGSWRVTEYVFNPDGSFAGHVQQNRQLHRLANDKIRVTQHCQPDPSLAQHPMGKFAGEWVFDLSVNGRVRHYEGPDVYGKGVTWGDGVMSGRGIWPRFAHNFTSFSILTQPGQQLTGGKFFTATELKANIIGLAHEDTPHQTAWPQLDHQTRPHQIATHWRGQQNTFTPDGIIKHSRLVTRHYTPDGAWQEANCLIELEMHPAHGRVTGRVNNTPLTGLAKQYGCLLEMTLYTANGDARTQWEVIDSQNNQLISWQKHFKDNKLTEVIITQLQPT